MSFMEKIAGVLARPGQNASSEDDHPIYMKYGGQVLGIVGSFFAILFGLYNCLGIIILDVSCLISGIIQMLVGFLVISIEAPLCCSCIEYADTASKLINSRPLWNKAALYCIVALPPVILCPGLGSLFGCGLIFGTGVIYGMMSLGKKATAEEMRNAAIQSGIAGGNNVTANDRSSIVNNAQPFSFTGAVGTDSNV